MIKISSNIYFLFHWQVPSLDLPRRIESQSLSLHLPNCFDCVTWYFIFSFHYSIFFTLLEFSPTLCVANDVVFNIGNLFYAFIFSLHRSSSGSQISLLRLTASMRQKLPKLRRRVNIISQTNYQNASSTPNKDHLASFDFCLFRLKLNLRFRETRELKFAPCICKVLLRHISMQIFSSHTICFDCTSDAAHSLIFTEMLEFAMVTLHLVPLNEPRFRKKSSTISK